MKPWVWIGVAGAAGVLSRVGLVHFFQSYGVSSNSAIFGINTLGSLVAGAVAGVAQSRSPFHPELYSALSVGFLGGFTTFSAFSTGTLDLLTNGAHARAALYLFGSPLIGLLAAAIGWNAGRWLA